MIRFRPLIVSAIAAGTTDLILGLLAANLWAERMLSAGFDRLGFEPMVTMGMVLSHTTERLVMGASVAWLYAAMRPRFGPGRVTVVAAGLTAWLLMIVQFAWVNVGWGLFTATLMGVFVLWGVLEMMVVAAVAAWAYERLGGS